MKSVLTIAGSDCSGGAGIQADIKTICAHNLYAQSVICALTAQNTIKISDILQVNPDFISEQLDCVFSDIKPNSVKIGMLFSSDIMKAVKQKLIEYNVTNVVIDPVMISSTKVKLIDEESLNFLKEELFVHANIITPNIHEAEMLTNTIINNKEDVINAIKIMQQFYHGAILIKGGHLLKQAIDFLYYDNEIYELRGNYIETKNTHGTGCTLSSSIACNLAQGMDILQSVKLAKRYVNNALKNDLNLGHGSGPLNHMYKLRDKHA